MTAPKGKKLGEVPVGGYEDIVLARHKVRETAEKLGFSLLDQTRIITAASELARNIVVHAGHGRMLVHEAAGRPGIVLTFEDWGPGIGDVEDALREGFSTGGSLGLGLPGARKLSDQMQIRSRPGQGATVEITKWLR